ncbi:hypothetical protein CDAR_83931 [Caerostris darwini]|uniref:Uncharacterized protein n=1 Tax=Caerostris darwini TaxID=1538125 RepID=A0AAV4WYV9_9ARAC|nr:hypothetical protein CDAR_83931 [Caerostris darwini]
MLAYVSFISSMQIYDSKQRTLGLRIAYLAEKSKRCNYTCGTVRLLFLQKRTDEQEVGFGIQMGKKDQLISKRTCE